VERLTRAVFLDTDAEGAEGACHVVRIVAEQGGAHRGLAVRHRGNQQRAVGVAFGAGQHDRRVHRARHRGNFQRVFDDHGALLSCVSISTFQQNDEADWLKC
jgi:hypothetical protein